MQKNINSSINELLEATDKIYRSEFNIPNLSEQQAEVIKSFVLKHVNNLPNTLVKRVKLENL